MNSDRRIRSWGRVVSRPGDRWIWWTTTGCVALLALIAGTVSYLHMHLPQLAGAAVGGGWECSYAKRSAVLTPP